MSALSSVLSPIGAYVAARFAERSTRRAICVVLSSAAVIGQDPVNWQNPVAWYALIGIALTQLVHVIDPDFPANGPSDDTPSASAPVTAPAATPAPMIGPAPAAAAVSR